MQLSNTGEMKPAATLPHSQTPAEFYSSLFDVKLAQDDADLRMSQALRYRVYCEETGFLPKADNPGALEIDELDGRSSAILLLHKPTGNCVGTVRIILPDARARLGGLPARLCSAEMRAIGPSDMPVATTGEISRFTIAPEFRRRSGDTLYQQVYDIEPGQTDMRRIIPYMALGLFAGILEVMVLEKLSHVCAIIDPALLRMLRRIHLYFQPVGGLVDFHGRRQPVITSCSDLYGGMKALPQSHLNIVNKNGTLDI